jgi:diaminopimelate epimerase
MADFYNARGNTYFVASPESIGRFAEIPLSAAEAAVSRGQWAASAIDRICRRPNASEGKKFLSDGLLVGPFPDENVLDTSASQDQARGRRFSMMIVNTDGTLAERSGNGLTIFSQFLVDTGQASRSEAFYVRVFHDKPAFIEARIEATLRDGREGFWIDMGLPRFGPSAVDASPEHVGISEFEGHRTSRVFALEEIQQSWTSSQFVNVGNPHCVTFLKSPSLLPSMEQLGSQSWMPRLTAIANSTESDGARGEGRPCKNGINLQWASLLDPNTIAARVFERGEGPTLSSGSSATAVASAARELGLVSAETVNVAMPGGVAPIRFDESDCILKRVMLFGEAQRANPG